MCKEFFEEKINQKLFEVYHLKSTGKNFKLIKQKLIFGVSIYSNNTPGQRDPSWKILFIKMKPDSTGEECKLSSSS